jgi:hypothetical protein
MVTKPEPLGLGIDKADVWCGEFCVETHSPRVYLGGLSRNSTGPRLEKQERERTQPDAVGNRAVAFQDGCLQPLGHHASPL